MVMPTALRRGSGFRRGGFGQRRSGGANDPGMVNGMEGGGGAPATDGDKRRRGAHDTEVVRGGALRGDGRTARQAWRWFTAQKKASSARHAARGEADAPMACGAGDGAGATRR
jgi:hypothetical protein